MSTFVFVLVLCGALLHASWNTVIKLSPDKPLETALMNISGSLLVLPALIYFGAPDVTVWPNLAATLVLHIIYYYSLSSAYRWGDMSLTYPIMRGVAPLILVILSSLLHADYLRPAVIGGIVFVSLGIVFLGLSPKNHSHLAKAISFALVNACVIALYTIVDGFGVRSSKEPFAYIAMFMFIDGFMYSVLLFHQRKWQIAQFVDYWKKRWRFFMMGALAAITSYGIALWAMTVSPISMISALREVSVLFALFIAYFFLKEQITVYRWFGVFLICVGAFLIKVNY